MNDNLLVVIIMLSFIIPVILLLTYLLPIAERNTQELKSYCNNFPQTIKNMDYKQFTLADELYMSRCL
jgi:hypothetical protein